MPPTLTGFYVRSVSDADKLFHAVKQGMLPLTRRRLDADERNSLQAGYVYVWEESRNSNSFDGIKRFTDGMTWDPSRAKDGFLVYLERKVIPGAKKPPVGTRVRTNAPLSNLSGKSDMMIKKTYAVFVMINGTRHNWHLNAYYTENSVSQLKNVDDLAPLRDLVVPPGLYRWAKATDEPNEERDIYRATPAIDSSGYSSSTPGPSSSGTPSSHDSPMFPPAVPAVPRAPSPMDVDSSGSAYWVAPESRGVPMSVPGTPRPPSRDGYGYGYDARPQGVSVSAFSGNASRPGSRMQYTTSSNHYGDPAAPYFGALPMTTAQSSRPPSRHQSTAPQPTRGDSYSSSSDRRAAASYRFPLAPQAQGMPRPQTAMGGYNYPSYPMSGLVPAPFPISPATPGPPANYARAHTPALPPPYPDRARTPANYERSRTPAVPAENYGRPMTPGQGGSGRERRASVSGLGWGGQVPPAVPPLPIPRPRHPIDQQMLSQFSRSRHQSSSGGR